MTSLILRELRPSQNPVLHRELVLEWIIRTIGRKERNNVLLLGEPGVGKTAIVEGLASRLKTPGKKPIFKGSIIELNTTALALLISEGDTAQLDTARASILKFAPAAILIDDARVLLTQTSQTGLLYFLAPLLENPQTPILMIVSMAEYRRFLEREPIFSRECEAIEIQELTLQETQDVLTNRTTPKLAHDCAVLAKRYIQQRALPDKAIRLLSDAEGLAIREGHPLTIEDAKRVIAERTGIPIDTLSAAEQEKLLNLESVIGKDIIGQPHVIEAVSNVIRRSRAGLKDGGRPIASFLFLGSSGVGKTELAKVLSRVVFHNERSLIRFDMSEFSEAHTVQRLVGAPPGYIGFEEGGQLTNAVLSQPYSLILLDELEKAHPRIFDMFLQVMDDGRLTDGKGRTVDFSNTIIIATSNLALDEILTGYLGGEPILEEKWQQERILPLLSSYFRLEFINRFDGMLVFAPFSPESLWKVAELELKKLQERLELKDIKLNFDMGAFKETVRKMYNPAFGARPIRRYLQNTVETDLAKKILAD